MTLCKSPRISLIALLIVGAIAETARAEPSPEEKAQADILFRDGRSLMNAEQFSLACAKFAESNRLDPAPGTLMNLALCHEREGKTASAWAELNEVADRPGDDPARGPFARTRAAALEKRLSSLRVVLSTLADGEVVSIDGRPLGSGAVGSPLPLDPGDHVIEATAPGHVPWKREVRVTPGPVLIDVDVPALDASVAAPPAPPPPMAPESSHADEHTAAMRESVPVTKIAGYAVGAAGLLAIGIGTYFGARTLSKKSDADALCPNNRCAGDPRVASLDDDAKSSALVSTVSMGLGAAAVVGGIVLVLTAPSADPAPTKATPRIATALALGRGRLSLVGEF
jgi:hypothetical protein